MYRLVKLNDAASKESKAEGRAVQVRKFDGPINGGRASLENEVLDLFNSSSIQDQLAAVRFTARLIAMERQGRVLGKVVNYSVTKRFKLNVSASIWTHAAHGQHLYYSFIASLPTGGGSEMRALSVSPSTIVENDRVRISADRHNLM